MLKGALQAMRVSEDVADVATDVGPLISAAAADAARAHCAALESLGGVLVAKTLGEDDGALFHPRVYDLNPDPGSDPLDGLEMCKKEVFAPVLHVVTYDGSRESLRETLLAMNEKGFALTGGVMTRCESTKALVTVTLDCGNFYVNRDVVGAVVESQPFGGHGLSGNGAKAGSEHYLEQFVARKVVCEDTTAAGGNLELMRTTG
jgi:RHH-type proline utilization regulon transcriptional repressor/proline dehydrogenase/delta 1-pyrroline-5-carboxylate dehydrogenase